MNTDATVAREALEQVCARGDLELAQEFYAADFVDHVNALDLHGHEASGARPTSTAHCSTISRFKSWTRSPRAIASSVAGS
jgi:hypothetical protein